MISVSHLLLTLAIVVLLFGTNKLKNIGSDLGNAIRGFRQSLRESEEETNKSIPPTPVNPQVVKDDKGNVIEGQVASKDKQQV